MSVKARSAHQPPEPGVSRGPVLSRRDLLIRGGGAALGAAFAPVALDALSRLPSAAAATMPTKLTGVSLQLDYLPNVQFAGTLMALDRGYYAHQGLKVDVLPGGPSLAPEPIVVSGKALVGITHTQEGFQAIANGAPLMAIGAAFQKSPTCLVSRADKAIKTPQEMIGKVIGVSDTNLPIWNAFLKVNKIDPSQVKVNTVQFSTQPLADGQIDGLIGFYTNEPIILDLQGVPTYAFLLADFGYPIVDDIYIVRADSLTDPVKRQQVVGIMVGEAEGWRAAFEAPKQAADLAVNVYGKGLDLVYKQQLESVEKEKVLVTSPSTAVHGLLWMDAATVAGTVQSLHLGGTKAAASSFTNEVLSEAYHSGMIS
jgi:ABC-type nitrate/sulfonate/bicarbonate transport system substrate-binding protein